MKKLNLMLLGALLSQTAFAQTSGGHFLYTYDGTGNITSRVRTYIRRSQNVSTKNTDEETLVKIKTNASWSEVQIEINKDVKDGDMLYIYTDKGLLVASLRLETNNVFFNLSNFKKGTYLFRYNRDKNITESKIVKTY